MEEEGGMKPIAVSLLVLCSLMNRLFGMTSFGKAMHGNLSFPGDWCCGMNADSVKGNEEAIRKSLPKDFKFQKEVLDMLLNYTTDFDIPPSTQSKSMTTTTGSKVMEYLTAYVMWWLKYSCALFGFYQTVEFGAMPKTNN
eukprot:scaffold128472_cov48-Attheya_sp.AAC.3